MIHLYRYCSYAYKGVSTMFPGTDVPRSYVPRYRCSPVPMFPGTDVPRTYVPRYLCSPVPMFPEPMFPGTDVPRFTANFIGVNITAFGRKLTLFSTIPLSQFSLKMSRFFATIIDFAHTEGSVYFRLIASKYQITRSNEAACCTSFHTFIRICKCMLITYRAYNIDGSTFPH